LQYTDKVRSRLGTSSTTSEVCVEQVPYLEDRFRVARGDEFALIGDAPKVYLISRSLGEAEAYIAKAARREGPIECVTEYLITRIARDLPLRTAEGRLVFAKDEEVRVYLETDRGRVYVGRLKRDREGFEFTYSAEFLARSDLPPIPDLPDKTRVYKATVLWPFFLARLPPTDRPDVREQLRAAGIAPDDTLEVLGKLGRRAISSPYDLELVAA